MEGGSLLAGGETQQLFDDPGTITVARMTGCKNFSAAQRLDSHTLRLLDWGTDLHLAREIPEDTAAMGYRAHFFEPVWGERQENCIPFHLSGMDELPFERRYYIIPAGRDCGNDQGRSARGEILARSEDVRAKGPVPAAPPGEELICWFVQDNERRALDEKPAPDWLRLQENAVMLLRG